MGDLAQLLELLYRAHERVSCLHAELYDWSHPAPSYELIVDGDGLAGGPARWQPPGPWPKESVSSRRLWFVPPERLRVEIMRNHALVRLGVRNGSAWWRWDDAAGAIAGEAAVEAAPGLPPLLDPPLLSPARLIPALLLEPTGMGVRAGREVLLARACPRVQPRAGGGVLSYELEFDAEHGTILRRAAFKDGRCFAVTEALQIRYGGDIADERFVFAAPDGQPAQRVAPRAALGRGGLLGQQSSGNGADSPARRARAGETIWLTGLSGAGKTTLALALEVLLSRLGWPVCVLDGDVLRGGLSSDLGLARADRAEQARRAAHVAAIVAASGLVAIVALVSPYADDRRRAREIHESLGLPFCEVWVDTPLVVCEQRDPKGLYARAHAGELQGLTGVDAPYEPPAAPDVRVNGSGEPADTTAARILGLARAARATP
jgi:bifunctional enzyme CysN/CysC